MQTRFPESTDSAPSPLHGSTTCLRFFDTPRMRLNAVFTALHPKFADGFFQEPSEKNIMAYAAYRESFGANKSYALPEKCQPASGLVVLDLTVPSCDAFQVRRLLAGCPDTGVVRCIPKPHDSMVLLEIQLPANRVQEVLHLLMTCIPSGEVGALTSWQQHMTEHGLTHGF